MNFETPINFMKKLENFMSVNSRPSTVITSKNTDKNFPQIKTSKSVQM